jgi:TPR repeat protein
LRLIELLCHDGLLVIEHNQEQSCQTMKLKRAIAAIVSVVAFAAPVAAGTFEDAVDSHARGDYAKALRLIRPLANDGDASAQFNLGLMYATGLVDQCNNRRSGRNEGGRCLDRGY